MVASVVHPPAELIANATTHAKGNHHITSHIVHRAAAALFAASNDTLAQQLIITDATSAIALPFTTATAINSTTMLNTSHHHHHQTNTDGDALFAHSLCATPETVRYSSIIGIDLAVPPLDAALIATFLGIIILVTIVGNTLVILSVFTYRPLRIVQNFFIVSLAVADLTVAILVLPLNVANMILGRWVFGMYVCKMWLTSDVLCCTSSILNLCAIALDRYWAITDPINYAQKRNVERVLWLCVAVWALSLLISSPPLIGWNDWPDVFDGERHPCALNQNPGYRVYSALGSFYIPLIIMSAVYIEIFFATRRRLRERAKQGRLGTELARGEDSNVRGGGETTVRGEVVRGAVLANRQAAVARERDSISSDTNCNEPVVAALGGAVDLESDQRAVVAAADEKSNVREMETNENARAKAQQTLPMPTALDDISADNSSTTEPKLTAADLPQAAAAPTPSCQAVVSPFSTLVPMRTPQSLQTHTQSVTVHQFIEEKQKISLSKERRAARTLGIIMGVFIACWVPFFLLYIIQPFCASCCPSELVIDLLTWLGYINSALNPIIYTIFNLDFRRAFKKLLGIRG